LAFEQPGGEGGRDFVQQTQQFASSFGAAIGNLTQMVGALKHQGDKLLKAIPEKGKFWTMQAWLEELSRSLLFGPDRSLLDSSVVLAENLPQISQRLGDLTRQCESLCECARESGLVPMDFPASSETARLRCLNGHLVQANRLLTNELRETAEELARVESVVDKGRVPVRERDFSSALREELRRVRGELGRWWHETDTITRILDGDVNWDAMNDEQRRKDDELAILRKVRDDVKVLCDALKEETKVSRDNERLKGKNGRLKGKNDRLKGENKKLTAEVERLRKENAEQQGTIDTLRSSCTQARELVLQFLDAHGDVTDGAI
jgi:septal ring factor EnvC (AmiA/AmiB activator)